MKRLLPAALLLVLSQAQAGLFDDDVARQRIDGLQAQVGSLSQRVEDAGRNQLDFANQIESLKAELAKLRGQLEELSYNLDATQKRQKDFYVDLDNRLRRFEQGAAPAKAEVAADGAAPEAGAKPAAPAANPANEGKDYETALMALKGSRFKEALAAFTAFIKNYPNSAQQPSAHFWAGYVSAQLKDHVRAAELYGKVAANWPSDARAPDALAEQAASLEAAGDKAGARKVWETLVEKYPGSDAAKRARPGSKKK
ncbi:tol-pal system protein YbgF [Denitratisoma sp. agr-D3]